MTSRERSPARRTPRAIAKKQPITERELGPLLHAAERAGLELPPAEIEAAYTSGALLGSIRGSTVSLSVRYRAGVPDGYVLGARATELFPGRVILRPAWVWPSLRSRGRVDSGDRDFERRVESFGPEPVVRAFLSAPARGILLDLAERGRFDAVQLADTRVSWRSVPGFDARAADLARVLDDLAAIATTCWVREDAVLDGLVKNATRDPNATTAFHAGRVLLEVLESTHDERTFRHLRALVTSREVDVAHRIEAFKRLREATPAKVAPLAESMLKERGPIARLAVDYLSSVGRTPELAVLVGAAMSGDEALGAAIVELVRRSGHAGAEAALIELLAHRAVDVRTVAARALGEVGSSRAVMPLEAATKGWLTDRSLVRAVRAALAAIRARSGAAEPGRLSLPADDEEEGAVSLADGAGQVSFPPKRR